MSWVFLALAIVLEIAGTTCMKLSEGFTRPVPSTLIFPLYGLSFACLTYALRGIDVSVAYAIWSGVGIAVIATLGALLFGEQMTLPKLVSLGLIVLGVVGLQCLGSE